MMRAVLLSSAPWILALAAAPAALPASPGPVLSPQQASSDQKAGPVPAGQEADADPVVARGRGLTVRRSQLEALLIDRYALSSQGRDILKLLVSTKVLDEMGREQGIEIAPEAVTRRWRELDDQVKAAGKDGGIAGEIAARGLSPEEFREYLRLQLLQEELTRRALDLAPDATVSPDSQEVWLGQTLADRGLENLPPPWTDGIVARCGDVTVATAELGKELLAKLDPKDVHESTWHLLLLEGLEKRMPDLSAEARAKAIQDEMQRRRESAEGQAKAQGQPVSFEELLRARGSSYATLARDPSVAIAALSRLWVDRTQGEDGLKREYDAQRSFYDGRYGTALHAYAFFLIAGQFKNDLVKRTFEEAEAEIAKVHDRFTDLESFRAYASEQSEDPTSRGKRGELGWVARNDPHFSEELRTTIFKWYDGLPKGTTEVPDGGVLLGPERLKGGVALFWVGGIRPTPGWDEMREHVHEELRKRLINDVMPQDAVEAVVE